MNTGIRESVQSVSERPGPVYLEVQLEEFLVTDATSFPNPCRPQPPGHPVERDDKELHDVSPPRFDLMIVLIVGGLGHLDGILGQIGGSGNTGEAGVSLRHVDGGGHDVGLFGVWCANCSSTICVALMLDK